MKIALLSVTSCAVALLLTACAEYSPQQRIKDNPAMFQSIDLQDRQLVMTGQLRVGMSPNAVWLAWGPPSSVAEGRQNGKSVTRWLYATEQPVYTDSIAMGGGYWGGPWGPRWGGPWCGPYGGMYNSVTFVPVNCGYVLFENAKVKSWERLK